MAFHKGKTARISFDSPESLFRDLRNRTVEGLLSHQADILREYQAGAEDKPNVAIELPTGSGKTLVGLLIAEFRRLTRSERVLYLCPKRQLVRQVVEQSERKYGIKATAFVGAVRDYDPSAKMRYQTGETIAVAPYSALFNTNPFFDSPQLIILDDAHAAENYIAANWSLLISRAEHRETFLGLLDMFREAIPSSSYAQFISDEPDFARWVENIPIARLIEQASAIGEFLEVHTSASKLKYPWSLLRGHLDTCQVYLSHDGILIRPYIPPSMTHAPFATATQRVFMSATLGRGGDLERMTGVRSFHRIHIPKGWDKQGIGRRFFVFPELSLKPEAIEPLVNEMIQKAGRALILVPSDAAAEAYRKRLTAHLSVQLFSANDIEASKDAFVTTDSAVAILANRYDGIDLLGDDCRLLIIEGLPKAGNLQETFLVSRMACGELLYDRIRTRIIQAVGRCTRSATDYALVCVLGEDFFDWLILREKRSLFHPELQGELRFGEEQSKDGTKEDLLENMSIFLEHGDEWNGIEGDILEHRDEADQKQLPGEGILSLAAPLEVDYQYAMWNQDYERCVELSQLIAGTLSGDAVKGLRGFWYYLGASAAELALSSFNDEVHREKAADLYARAAGSLPALGWLRQLAKERLALGEDAALAHAEDQLLATNIERMESVFDSRGYASQRKFEREAESILSGLASKDSVPFEDAHCRLGKLLGFEADNAETEAAPDPWWISNSELCVVAEDKSDSNPEHSVPVRHTRQAASHAKWIAEHVPLDKDPRIITVMITPQRTIHSEVPTFADDVMWWHIDDFRSWAMEAINVLRRARSLFTGPGSVLWRNSVAELLRGASLDPTSIVQMITKKKLADLPVSGKPDE